MKSSTNPWFKVHDRRENAKLRLFCFPYAGGNANVFADWHRHMEDNVEVVAIQPPGRGERFTEPPIGNLSRMVNELADAIVPFLEKPFSLFGHSNGALVAFELAREMERRHHSFEIEHLFIAGNPAPQLRRFDPALHDLPDEELKVKLRELNGTPAEILENSELLSFFLPVLRADFSLAETHKFDPSTLLSTDLTLFGGKEDIDISEDDLLGWAELVDGDAKLFMVDGGHFFIHESRKSVCSIVSNTLRLGAIF